MATIKMFKGGVPPLLKKGELASDGKSIVIGLGNGQFNHIDLQSLSLLDGSFKHGDYVLLDKNGKIPSDRINGINTPTSEAHPTTKKYVDTGLNTKASRQEAGGGFSGGADNQGEGGRNVVIGKSLEALGDDVVALGQNSKAKSTNTVVIGNNSQATGTDSVVLGHSAQGSDKNQVVIGKDAGGANSGIASVLIGKGAQGTGLRCVQIGEGVNNENDTVKLKGWKMLASNGKIPLERFDLDVLVRNTSKSIQFGALRMFYAKISGTGVLATNDSSGGLSTQSQHNGITTLQVNDASWEILHAQCTVATSVAQSTGQANASAGNSNQCSVYHRKPDNSGVTAYVLLIAQKK